jgi:Lower baseplate protein N-terminal domain
MSENVLNITPTFALKFLGTKMIKNVSAIILLLISVCGFAQTYGSYCDTCVYQLSRDSLNRPQFQGGKVITPPIHKATMLMMNRKMYQELMAITLNLNTKADLNNVVTLTTAQTITGKKRFSDTLISDKGMKSGGIIETKGLNSEGSATKAAISLKGVQSERDTIVSTDFTFDGRYGTIGFDTSSGTKNGTLPQESNTVGWFFVIRKETDDTNELRLKDSNGVVFYTIKSKMSITIKNKNGIWKREK